MAALSASTTRQERNIHNKRLGSVILTSAVQAYKGSLLCVKDGALTAILCADLGEAGGFIGMAEEELLGDGVKKITYSWGQEVLLGCESDVVDTTIGHTVYAMTDNGVTAASTVGPAVGKHTELPTSSTAWVELGSCGLPANT